MGSLSLFQGIFPTQGLNSGLLHCRRILYQLSHKGSQRILEWVAYPFSRGSSRPKNWTLVSCTAGRFLINWAIKEAPNFLHKMQSEIPSSFPTSRSMLLLSLYHCHFQNSSTLNFSSYKACQHFLSRRGKQLEGKKKNSCYQKRHCWKFPRWNELPPFFDTYIIFVTSFLVSNLDYIITHSSLFSSHISGTTGEGNGNPLQSSCLENPVDGGAW